MSNLVQPHATAPESEHGHSDASSMTLFGFWIYLMTNCILFATLFATYAVLGQSVAGGPGAADIFERDAELRRDCRRSVRCSALGGRAVGDHGRRVEHRELLRLPELIERSERGMKPENVAGVIMETYQGVGPDFAPVEFVRELDKAKGGVDKGAAIADKKTGRYAPFEWCIQLAIYAYGDPYDLSTHQRPAWPGPVWVNGLAIIASRPFPAPRSSTAGSAAAFVAA